MNLSASTFKTALKTAALAAAFIGLYAASRHQQARELFALDGLKSAVDAQGALGPLYFFGVYFVGIFLFIPPSVFNLAGGALFGQWAGLLICVVSMNVSANAAFWLMRALGKKIFKKFDAGKLKRVNERANANGTLTVTYMRLAFVPNWLVNYFCALSGLRASHFALGTFIGSFPVAFTLCFLGDGAYKILRTGDFRGLASWTGAAALLFFALAAAAPFIIEKKMKGGGKTS